MTGRCGVEVASGATVAGSGLDSVLDWTQGKKLRTACLKFIGFTSRMHVELWKFYSLSKSCF